MNVENLVRKAVADLKSQWDLPAAGFIAGGSIANLVWEYHSGNKAKINDIDVFVKSEPSDEQLLNWQKKEFVCTNNYNHLTQCLVVSDKYKIYSVSREGMLNYINVSEDASPLTILKSFDINATAVGYSIDEDKVYFLPEFEEFLETKKLQIICLMTPAHTAIRLMKKADDLNAYVDDTEFEIIQYCLMDRRNIIKDITRFRFLDKYLSLYRKYSETLDKYFYLTPSREATEWLKQIKKKDISLWELKPKASVLEIPSSDYSFTSNDVLFFFRNCYGDKKKTLLFKHMQPFYKVSNYLDTTDGEIIRFMFDFSKSYVSTSKTLAGLTITQQYEVVKKVMQSIAPAYGERTAVKVIEAHKIKPDQEIDDYTAQLYALSVRKAIARDTCDYDNAIYLPF